MSNKGSNSKTRVFWPVMGFILALSLGIIAWALGPLGYSFLRDHRIINFDITYISRETWELIISGALFGVLILLSSLIVAAARPKQKTEVVETKLKKEREKMLREMKARKELQRRINRQMKDR